MTVAIVLIIVGVFIAAGNFIFALFNMGRQAKKVFDGNTNQELLGFGGAFARHLGAMAGLSIGGLVALVGIVLLFIEY